MEGEELGKGENFEAELVPLLGGTIAFKANCERTED